MIPKDDLFKTLPPEGGQSVRSDIEERLRHDGRKIVVLDDDLPGTLFHGVPVLMDWSVDLLEAEFRDDSSVFFIFTHSRSLTPAATEALHAEIAINLLRAQTITGRDFVIASRGNATLNGHFPLETSTLMTVLSGDFDATLLIPAFIEGGWYTINDVQLLQIDENLIPAEETVFAQDRVFGYKTSNLYEWIDEKVGFHFDEDSIVSISIDTIREGGVTAVLQQLMKLKDRTICIVNATSQHDVEVVTLAVLLAEAQGKCFIYHSAESFIAARSGWIYRDPSSSDDRLSDNNGYGGLVVMGLEISNPGELLLSLQENNFVTQIEIDSAICLENERLGDEVERCAAALTVALQQGDAVVCVNRNAINDIDTHKLLEIEARLSESLMAVLRSVKVQPRYVMAIGNVTVHDVATKILHVNRAVIGGQIHPHVAVWQSSSSVYPGMPYVVCSGDFIDAALLSTIMSRLQK